MTQISEWKRHPVVGSRIVHRCDLHDRYVAYVDVDSCWDTGRVLTYHWSVQDGSCGKVLDQDWLDGDAGLEAAMKAAQDAAVKLFPHLAR